MSSNSFIPQVEAAEYKKYRNLYYGYMIDYPSDWEKQESPDSTEVRFISPGISGASFIIISSDVDEESAELSLHQVSQIFIEGLKIILPNFQINQNYDSALDKNPAQKIEFSASSEGNKIAGIAMFTLKDERGFVLAIFSEPKDFRDSKKIGQQMFDSFEIFEKTVRRYDFGLLTNYQSNLLGFSIDIPSNWYLDDTIIPYDPIPGVSDSHSSVLFLSDGTGEYYDNALEVYHYKNLDWVMKYQGQDYLNGLVGGSEVFCKTATFNGLGFECSNHSIINAKITEINEKQAYQIIETRTEKYLDGNTFDAHVITTHVVDGNDLWEIISTNVADDYRYNSDTINKIIQSFKVDTKDSSTSSDAILEEKTKPKIPDWIRNNAKWWVSGNIDDGAFVGGIQFLIEEGIIQIPETVTQSSESDISKEIPAWIKSNADWWSQGLISDDDFIKGIQHLVKQGIIQL